MLNFHYILLFVLFKHYNNKLAIHIEKTTINSEYGLVCISQYLMQYKIKSVLSVLKSFLENEI